MTQFRYGGVGSVDSPEVLIAGAGPTGLVLALWLTRQGVQVRIVDRALEPGTTSRALAVQVRTLELYRQLDLADALVAAGHRVPAINLWARGRRAAHVPFPTLGEGLTPYPFIEIFPQDEHERLLIGRLAALGVQVERGTELLSFEQQADSVAAQLKSAAGELQHCKAAFLAGCDGARSRVREILGTGFEGGTYRQLFYVADIEGAGAPVDGELHVDLDEADFLAVFPLAGSGRVRLVGVVSDARADHADTLRFEDVSTRAMDNLGLQVRKVNWFSTYHVHHRVSAHFRRGRVLLLGDAAHIHSPVGGQGMNTGIGDAVNLAWKLRSVLSGQAGEALLDTYEVERMAFARRLVATTDRAFSIVSASGRVADPVRTRLAPAVISRALKLQAVREYLFRTISQIRVNYRDMPLSAGVAGEVRGGDRLPWVPYADGKDNFLPLTQLSWQIHVYGAVDPALARWCARRDLALHGFAWSDACAAAGLMRDALYLLRPDSYVALASPTQNPAMLEDYFSARGIGAAG